MDNPEKHHSNTKRCRVCKRELPIRAFENKRHRQCAECRSRNGYPQIEAWAAVPSGPSALARVWEHDVDSWVRSQPGGSNITGSAKSNWEYHLKYTRERQRMITRLNNPDLKPIDPNKRRKCRRCGQHKLPMFMSNNGRGQLCLVCDGPQVRFEGLGQE